MSQQPLLNAQECFLGFEFSQETLVYLEPWITGIYEALRAAGLPFGLVPPDKWHITMLYFHDLSKSERADMWQEVEAAATRGAWNHPGFKWKELALWPTSRVAVLASEKYAALDQWGLQSWLEHPLSMKAKPRSLQSYTPHVTMMRLKTGPLDKAARAKWADDWKRVLAPLPQIDMQRVIVDRITFFLSDYSHGPHRYIREHTLKIR